MLPWLELTVDQVGLKHSEIFWDIFGTPFKREDVIVAMVEFSVASLLMRLLGSTLRTLQLGKTVGLLFCGLVGIRIHLCQALTTYRRWCVPAPCLSY